MLCGAARVGVHDIASIGTLVTVLDRIISRVGSPNDVRDLHVVEVGCAELREDLWFGHQALIKQDRDGRVDFGAIVVDEAVSA